MSYHHISHIIVIILTNRNPYQSRQSYIRSTSIHQGFCKPHPASAPGCEPLGGPPWPRQKRWDPHVLLDQRIWMDLDSEIHLFLILKSLCPNSPGLDLASRTGHQEASLKATHGTGQSAQRSTCITCLVRIKTSLAIHDLHGQGEREKEPYTMKSAVVQYVVVILNDVVIVNLTKQGTLQQSTCCNFPF